MTYYWKNRDQLNCSLNFFYKSIGTSKQSFHQKLARSNRYQEEVLQLLELISHIRIDHPQMGCRTLYYKINPCFVGRDKFEQLCKVCGLMVEKTKNYRRTTDSSGVIRFDNLLTEFEICKINQVWSSDITYYDIGGVFYYLTFIIDNYSRRIIGHHASSRLTTSQTSLPALRMAIKTRGRSIPEGIIFHSDGGGQYYNDDFLRLTEKYKFKNSMCEYAWENGKAERVNGIIKNDYLIPWGVRTAEKLFKNIDRAVLLYNSDRPHSCLGRLTPMAFEENCSKFALCERSEPPEIDSKIDVKNTKNGKHV